MPGLPFDDATGTIPHRAGRVIDPSATGTDDAAAQLLGVYVTGWIKRGPSGFIGTNKTDSAETVGSLLADLEAGVLGEPHRTRRKLLARR